jgi:hypothetical protein
LWHLFICIVYFFATFVSLSFNWNVCFHFTFCLSDLCQTTSAAFFCRFVFLSNFLDVSLFWRLMHATLAKFSERRNDRKLLQSPSEYFKTQFRSLWTSVGWLERSNFLTFTFRFFFNRTIFSKHIVQILNCSILFGLKFFHVINWVVWN